MSRNFEVGNDRNSSNDGSYNSERSNGRNSRHESNKIMYKLLNQEKAMLTIPTVKTSKEYTIF